MNASLNIGGKYIENVSLSLSLHLISFHHRGELLAYQQLQILVGRTPINWGKQ